MKYFLLLYLFVYCIGCSDSPVKTNTIFAQHEFALKTLSDRHFNPNYFNFDEKNKIKLLLENYLKNILYSDRDTKRIYWDGIDNEFFNSPDIFLKTFITEELLLANPPHLLALQRIDTTKYKAVIGFYNKNNFLIKISSLYILLKEGKYVLTNSMLENMRDFDTVTSRMGLEYIVSPSCSLDNGFIEKVDSFNIQVAEFFKVESQVFRIIVALENTGYLKVIGFDYSFKHNLDYNTGAITYPSENMIVVGNCGKASLLHEIVHLYTAYNRVPHPWLNEGVCTYLGGSGTKEFRELIPHIAEHLKRDSTLTIDDFPNFIALETRYTSVLGALLIELAMAEGGKQKVFKLLRTENTKSGLYQAIYDVFGVKEHSINEFINEKIINYELKR